jgi:hypothetical protein
MHEPTLEPAEGHGTSNPFTTTDLDLASYLACHDVRPSDVRPALPHSFPRFATFVFGETEELQKAIKRWSDDDPVLIDLREFLKERHDYYRRVRSLRRGNL